MTITRANNATPGLRHYYIKSDSGASYVVTYIRREGMRRWACSCPNWVFVRSAHRSNRYCKHISAVLESLRIAKSEVAA